ncbi:hypothetical protein A8E67_35700 [Burkholderia cenocepacia]|nr:hypothetical protein A8E67_35700 [Burkholderia cenocepacia]
MNDIEYWLWECWIDNIASNIDIAVIILFTQWLSTFLIEAISDGFQFTTLKVWLADICLVLLKIHHATAIVDCLFVVVDLVDSCGNELINRLSTKIFNVKLSVSCIGIENKNICNE